MKYPCIKKETIPGMGEKGIKKNDRGDELNYDIFDIL
jgi:hypothetical protein